MSKTRLSRTYFDHQFVLLVELTLDFVVLVDMLLALLAALANRRLEFLHARFANRLGHEFVLRGEILQFFQRRTEGHGERVPSEWTRACHRATIGVPLLVVEFLLFLQFRCVGLREFLQRSGVLVFHGATVFEKRFELFTELNTFVRVFSHVVELVLDRARERRTGERRRRMNTNP